VDAELAMPFLSGEHAAALFALICAHRTYLARWLSWPEQMTSLEDTRTFIRSLTRQFAEGRALMYALEYQGELVGICGFNRINRHQASAQMGYWLAEPWQRRGIVTRACRHLLSQAFMQSELQSVVIAVAEENLRSQAVCERLGMQLSGRIPDAEQLADRRVDHLLYRMQKTQWEAE
jgi:ribosomal-protein-serine acetyltransferase